MLGRVKDIWKEVGNKERESKRERRHFNFICQTGIKEANTSWSYFNNIVKKRAYIYISKTQPHQRHYVVHVHANSRTVEHTAACAASCRRRRRGHQHCRPSRGSRQDLIKDVLSETALGEKLPCVLAVPKRCLL